MTIEDITNSIRSTDSTIYQIYDMSWMDLEKLIGYSISKKHYDEIINIAVNKILDTEWEKYKSKKPIVNLNESKLVRVSSSQLDINIKKVSMCIRDCHYMSVYYQHSNGEYGFRLIEPYVMGMGYTGSEEHKNDYYLRCFVIKDSREDVNIPFIRSKSISVSEKTPYWRILRLDRVHNINIIKRKRRHYRSEYTGGSDKHISNILKNLTIGKLRKLS